MTYAPATRAYYDADSHIMELPDFLKKYADPGLRDEIPEVSYSASVVTDEEVAVIVGQGNRHSDTHRAEQIAMAAADLPPPAPMKPTTHPVGLTPSLFAFHLG